MQHMMPLLELLGLNESVIYLDMFTCEHRAYLSVCKPVNWAYIARLLYGPDSINMGMSQLYSTDQRSSPYVGQVWPMPKYLFT